jgi:hypothetical protein
MPVAASVICLTTLGQTAEAQEVVQRIRQVDPTLGRLCTEAHAGAARTPRRRQRISDRIIMGGPGAAGSCSSSHHESDAVRA